MSISQDFFKFILDSSAIRFGEFKTKAGRISPYFFNTGLISSGKSLTQLGDFYAKVILESGLDFNFIFGPAYKGITIAAATSISLYNRSGIDYPFSSNRKEIKDHGEGGNLVGPPPFGKVIILDDVLSAGTSVRESIKLISSYGAEPVAIVVALDRQEKGYNGQIASDDIKNDYPDISIISIANLNNLIDFLSNNDPKHSETLKIYKNKYG